jgi:4-hydroxy-2-oxoheptanedioate aldolase
VRANTIRDAWDAGRCATNAWCSIGAPYGAEILAAAGYDAVTVDLQHGMFGVDAAIGMLQAISAQAATPLVRVPALDPAIVMKMLDAGAYGVICPMIETADQAAQLVAACRYPPRGNRSYGPSRGLLHGGSDYVEHADDTVLAWAMVETRAGLAALDAICATPDLDAIYIGPSDLASDLGQPIGAIPLPPALDEAIDRIITTAHAAGVRVGIFCVNEDMATDMVRRGVDLVTVRNDAGLLRHASAQILGRLANVER